MKFNFGIDATKINLDQVAVEEAKKTFPRSHATILENVLNTVLQTKYMGGLQGAKLRSLNRVLLKVDMSFDGTIELEQAELDLFKEVFGDDEVRVPVQMVRAYSLLQAEFDKTLASIPPS